MAHQQYEYKCVQCGTRMLSGQRGDCVTEHCRHCGEPRTMRRVWAVSLQRPIQSHFNTYLGQEVTGNRDFAEKLKRRGAEYTERTGIETNYQPVDPSYIASKVDGTGLDSQNRARVARGEKPIKLPA